MISTRRMEEDSGTSVAQFFAEGGFAMYPIALFGLVAVVLGAMALGTKSKGLAIGALGLAALVMVMGVGGMMWGRKQTDDAIAMVNPADAELIRVQGHKEANRPLQLAGPFCVLGALLGMAGFATSKQR